MKFKVKTFVLEEIEKEIEANNKEDAEEKFCDLYEEGEIEPEEGILFFENDEGFDVLKGLLSENEEGVKEPDH